MAVTWAASAPHATAVKEVQKAGIGSGYGSSGSSVFEALKWPGNKRAVLTKLTATGTYTTGGDAVDESLLGLKEVHAAFLVASPTTGVLPSNLIDGVPVVLCTTSTAPKVQVLDEGAEIANGSTVTGFVFHVILVGI
jgi:hypothetical protein